MTLKQKIFNDLKLAMKEGNVMKRDTLRMLDSMIKNTEIEKLKKEAGLDDKEVQEVIARAIKQRKDSVVQYKSGGREDLAQKESQEIEILMAYMPKQLGEDEIKTAIKKIISEIPEASAKDMGKIMGLAMGKLKGKADGQIVRKIVEEALK